MVIVTDRRISYRPLPEQLGRALEGVRQGGRSAAAVLFGERDLDPAARLELARAVATVCASAGALFLVRSTGSADAGPQIAKELSADGIHLASEATIPSRAPAIIGRSCHDARDVRRAELEGVDYITLSPVFDSISKIGYRGKGLELISQFGRKAGSKLRPLIYALGGVAPGKAADCISAGAYGVCVCGALMLSEEPASVARALAAEIADVETRMENRCGKNDRPRLWL